jgi:hypothetical protein
MEDDELRSQLTAWSRLVGQISIPSSSVFRRRLRRRRAAQATAGALTVACVASAGLAYGLSRAPRTSTQTYAASRGDCVSRQLRVTWLPPAKVNGVYMEGPPHTYLLAVRNSGPSACVLEGWPRLVPTGPPRRHMVSVSYRTHFDEWVKVEIYRVVRPTRVVLRAGATALSRVTVSLPPALLYPCVKLSWSVRPPARRSELVRTRGDRPEICSGTLIEVSPLYPSRVPITSNYPRQ